MFPDIYFLITKFSCRDFPIIRSLYLTFFSSDRKLRSVNLNHFGIVFSNFRNTFSITLVSIPDLISDASKSFF